MQKVLPIISKKFLIVLIGIMLVASMIMFISPGKVYGATIIKNYGDVSLSGGFESGNFSDEWDLTKSDLTISFTYDAYGLMDDFGGDTAHAWAELGIRDNTTVSNFNPNNKGVWLSTDFDWTINTFSPDPAGSPNLDLDDKLILQKQSGIGEAGYNLPSVPPVPGNNHRFWWDRDGVDSYQNGETANTGGLYNIVITLHATDASSGTAYMKIKGLDQGFETNGDFNTIELTPAGMTFAGDMAQMQVFYGLYGYGATHSIAFKNIKVEGSMVESTPPPDGGGTTTATSDISVLGITEGGSIADFVTQRCYGSILLREPDAAGLAGWVDALTNGGLTGEDAARGFIYSDELKMYLAALDNTGYLNFLYNRVLGREADLPGLNGWLSAMSGGMTREEIIYYFLNSPEWYAICSPYGVTP